MGTQFVGAELVRRALPHRREDGHKGTFGKVLIVGRCRGLHRCAVSWRRRRRWRTAAGWCPWRTGVHLAHRGGEVQLRHAVSAAGADGRLCLGALAAAAERLQGCDVLALGPGLGRGDETAELVWALLGTEKPVVLDADGINALSGHIDVLDARRDKVTVLTPHAVEFSRIGGDLSHGDRQQAARDFAMRHGCVLVMKGHGR